MVLLKRFYNSIAISILFKNIIIKEKKEKRKTTLSGQQSNTKFPAAVCLNPLSVHSTSN